MPTVEELIDKIRASGLRVIMAAEYDQDYWIVHLAKNRNVPCVKWHGGRGKTLAEGLAAAFANAKRNGKRVEPTPAPAVDQFEDLLG